MNKMHKLLAAHPTLLLLEQRTAEALILALRIRFWLGVCFGVSAACAAWWWSLP